jgi:hypothetical protein
MPTDWEAARRWRQLAEEASSIARRMTDPQAIQIMRRIVQGYELLAEHAKKRALRVPADVHHSARSSKFLAVLPDGWARPESGRLANPARETP